MNNRRSLSEEERAGKPAFFCRMPIRKTDKEGRIRNFITAFTTARTEKGLSLIS